jgi:hypothetical protein
LLSLYVLTSRESSGAEFSSEQEDLAALLKHCSPDAAEPVLRL